MTAVLFCLACVGGHLGGRQPFSACNLPSIPCILTDRLFILVRDIRFILDYLANIVSSRLLRALHHAQLFCGAVKYLLSFLSNTLYPSLLFFCRTGRRFACCYISEQRGGGRKGASLWTFPPVTVRQRLLCCRGLFALYRRGAGCVFTGWLMCLFSLLPVQT